MTKKIILFVAMPDSIHTARWLNQLKAEDWDIHLFPSTISSLSHSDIYDVTLHGLFYSNYILNKPKSKFINFVEKAIYFFLRRFFANAVFNWQVKKLAKLINDLKPDIVHSLEFQHSAYLTLAAKQYCDKFPYWMVTNWGSDIFFFGRFPEHELKIRQVLAECDAYACECQRDVGLAREFGFNKSVLPVFPNTGGFDLATLAHRRSEKTSERRLVMLKGYQHFAGRALIGLQALALCQDVLQGFTVMVYSANPIVVEAAATLAEQSGIVIKIIPRGTPHDVLLSYHGQARVSIGLSVSDAISTSLLEAMVMGSLPIQSCTACADEWIEHGVSGAIVPPEDPEIAAMWLRKALTDDVWVNQAAELNWQTALVRLDGEMLAKQAVAMYKIEQS